MVESHYDNDLIHLFRSPLCHRDSGFERGLIFFFFNDTATTEIYTLSPTRRSSDLARHPARRAVRARPLSLTHPTSKDARPARAQNPLPLRQSALRSPLAARVGQSP